MEHSDTIGFVEPIPEWNEAEWRRQIFGSSMPLVRPQTAPAPQGKLLWLTVRRALCMVIAAFDAHYGVEAKKR